MDGSHLIIVAGFRTGARLSVENRGRLELDHPGAATYQSRRDATACSPARECRVSGKKTESRRDATNQSRLSKPCFFNNNLYSVAEFIFLWCSFWFAIYRMTVLTWDLETLPAKYPSCQSKRVR